MAKKSCGAKTRSGEPCKKAPLEGKTRCANHGGKSTGPKNQRGNKNAAKPGSIYSQYLTPEEQIVFDSMELGKVDDELKLTRIRLARALAKEQERPEIDAITIREGGKGVGFVPMEKSFKRRDYVGIIDKLTARIESLERTRAELLLKDVAPLEDDRVTELRVTVVTPKNHGQSA